MDVINKNVILLSFLLSFLTADVDPSFSNWGFQAHITINHAAIYSLPRPLFTFYHSHLNMLEKYSIQPDQRRYIDRTEGPRHYIDLDIYPDSLVNEIYKSRPLLDSIYGKSFVTEHGELPWVLYLQLQKLTRAFQNKDTRSIIRHSFELGHYAADAQVPLHTISNYNGQFSEQEGIHSLWETRLPQLFIEDYNLTVDRAEYLNEPNLYIWKSIVRAHYLSDSVLAIEKKTQALLGEDRKYSFTSKFSIKREVSYEYASTYHSLLNDMVEQQMRSSIKLIADLWFTCWINAGMPDLKNSKNLR